MTDFRSNVDNRKRSIKYRAPVVIYNTINFDKHFVSSNKGKMKLYPIYSFALKIIIVFQMITGTQSLSLRAALSMPPMDLGARRHTSDFSARKNHPASYEDSPNFKGPLILTKKYSTSDNRTRIKNFYQESDHLVIPQRQPHPLTPSANTDLILKTIMDNFALNDAPIDAKEMAESMEVYLRTRKRLLGIANKRIAKISKDSDENEEILPKRKKTLP